MSTQHCPIHTRAKPAAPTEHRFWPQSVETADNPTLPFILRIIFSLNPQSPLFWHLPWAQWCLLPSLPSLLTFLSSATVLPHVCNTKFITSCDLINVLFLPSTRPVMELINQMCHCIPQQRICDIPQRSEDTQTEGWNSLRHKYPHLWQADPIILQ